MRRLSWRRAPVLLLVVGLSACGLSACGLFGGHSHDDDRTSPVLFSPNGEPLSGGPLGHPSCSDAMARWFDRVDGNGDGTVTLDEYLADARRQFAAMDLAHDGILTPAELSQYRAPYAARPQAGAPGGPTPRRGGEERSAGSSGDLTDPVMAADVNLRNHVTLNDFLAYARRQFAALASAAQGRLTKAEVLRFCVPAT